MSKVLAPAALVAAVLLLPLPGSADHVPAVPDGLDCANLPAGAHPVTTSEQDRGAACISDGNAYNGAEYYVGGDAVTEEDYPDTPEDDTGEPCGAVIVGGQLVSGTRPDDPSTLANEAFDWDWMHPHPDGTVHHHTCN